MKPNMIFVKTPSDIPTEPHYAVIEPNSVHIPGDERSRTNPGHGYPAETKHFISYMALMSLPEVEEFLKLTSTETRKRMRVIGVTPVVIKETVTLEVVTNNEGPKYDFYN